MANSWIVATDARIGALVEAARLVGGSVTVVAVGEGAGYTAVDSVISVPLPEGVPAEAAAPAVAAAVNAQAGDVVFAANRPAERALAGAVAARLSAPVLTGVRAYAEGVFETARYGGIAEQQVRVPGVAVVVMDGGAAVEGDPVAPTAAAGEFLAAEVTGQATSEVVQVNLGAAKKIVAVGRGFKSEEDLQLARDLAASIGAELACTRPLAEGSDWMPKDTYIGVSGAHVAPDLYVAVGISGQLQHSVGATGSKTIVVINSDANAPYFADADYGVVGDLYQVLPALTAALN